MIKIFYGDDRVKAQAAIKKLLGDDYEVIEGENLLPSDMASVFYGGSLFSDERKILIKDLSTNDIVTVVATDELIKDEWIDKANEFIDELNKGI